MSGWNVPEWWIDPNTTPLRTRTFAECVRRASGVYRAAHVGYALARRDLRQARVARKRWQCAFDAGDVELAELWFRIFVTCLGFAAEARELARAARRGAAHAPR